MVFPPSIEVNNSLIAPAVAAFRTKLFSYHIVSIVKYSTMIIGTYASKVS